MYSVCQIEATRLSASRPKVKKNSVHCSNEAAVTSCCDGCYSDGCYSDGC